MSLLMRRRSGQTLDPLADESLVSHRSPAIVPPMPDNYDPSIRGHIVHDFNAPRMNRNFSYSNAYGSDQPQSDLGRVSPLKIEREHTPVFREHFDDDTSYEQSQAAIRAEKLANNDFLARNSVQSLPPDHSPPPPPPLPKDLPPVPPPMNRPATNVFDNGASTVLSPVQETPDSLDVSADVTPRKRKSTKTPPPSRSRATSIGDPSYQPAGLPAHFTSRASRFSFQISSGADSAQEKILEDRHKQKAAEKASKEVRMSTNTLDDEYDEYGMDDFDMDGGFEEDIPMLGEEDEFGGGLGDQSIDDGIAAFDFSTLSIQTNMNGLHSPMIPTGQIQTPVDANGMPIGFAMSSEMLQQFQHLQNGNLPSNANFPVNQTGGLGLVGFQPDMQSALQLPSTEQHPDATPASATNTNSGMLDLDDDMYFDDGLIGEQEGDNTAEFDEDMFDDPNGPLYDRKVKGAPVEDPPRPTFLQSSEHVSSEAGYEADDDTMTRNLEKSEPTLAHKNSVAQPLAAPMFSNMNAYHSALADAATRAEAAGRFARKASTDAGHSSSDVEDLSSMSNSHPSLIPDDARFSLDTEVFPPDDDGFGMSSGFDDYDYSEYDSALEDDPMIAAANAEALAYDDEGFYGQEFGFYASAVGDSQENTWGGFFGPSGLGRSVSGRNAMREPNLTPITERSEYSTRNSFISLHHFHDGQQPITSPGLAQLARMSPYGWLGAEEDMSMDTLMKLRKGAFGGSVPSLPGSASNSPRTSSPMGMQFIPRMSSATGHRLKEHSGSELESDESANIQDDLAEDAGDDDEGLMNAVNAAYEDEDDGEASEGEERPESPTLTANDYKSLSGPDNHLMQAMPPLPTQAQLQALHSTQSPTSSLPLLQEGLALKSPSNMPLPMSPYGIPLPSPCGVQQRSTGPPSIDTSLSSPSATVSNSTGPRRQSANFSPISTTSPMTPSGSGWRAGHSRKCSAADSVTYVREHDEAGEGRWVLERRRTAESGELELIGREIVEGGRI